MLFDGFIVYVSSFYFFSSCPEWCANLCLGEEELKKSRRRGEEESSRQSFLLVNLPTFSLYLSSSFLFFFPSLTSFPLFCQLFCFLTLTHAHKSYSLEKIPTPGSWLILKPFMRCKSMMSNLILWSHTCKICKHFKSWWLLDPSSPSPHLLNSHFLFIFILWQM